MELASRRRLPEQAPEPGEAGVGARDQAGGAIDAVHGSIAAPVTGTTDRVDAG
jgi:hypothetical protein